MRAGLRDGTYKSIESILRTYKQYPEWIKQREQEIMFLTTDVDENVGGGKSNVVSNPTERTVTNLIMDKRLSELRREYNAVQYAFDNCTQKGTREIIELYYFKQTHTWVGVAKRVHYSVRYCIKLRDDFIKTMADFLGRV